VVSLRVFDSERERVQRLGMRYVHISFKPVHPEDEDVLEFLTVATDPSSQPVFVHCRDGTDRTGMMVAAYRVVIQGWSKQKAIDEMEAAGFRDMWKPIESYIKHLEVDKFRSRLSALGRECSDLIETSPKRPAT